jgi:transposase
MTKKSRNRHDAAFKAKVALEAVKEQQTVPELARRYGVHTSQIYKWKAQFLAQAARVFETEGDAASSNGNHEREQELLQKIGELTVERDFLSNGLARRR